MHFPSEAVRNPGQKQMRCMQSSDLPVVRAVPGVQQCPVFSVRFPWAEAVSRQGTGRQEVLQGGGSPKSQVWMEAREKAPREKSPENREGRAAGRKAQGTWEAAAGTVSVPGLGRFGL